MSIRATVRSLAVLATVASLAAALAGTAAAQCQFSLLTVQSVAPSCNLPPTGCCAVVAIPAQVVPTLDVTNCTVEFAIPAIEGCCGVSVPFRFLAIGVIPAVTPLPAFGANCAMWLVPDQFFVLGTPVASIALAIPPTLPPMTFLAQGAVLVKDAFRPLQPVMALSDALSIALR